jgi:methyl-accepting chemotaxis protein-3 (ribose and galactose sensor receptor)
VGVVEDTGRTMSEMVDAVKRVTELMSSIAAASQEQLSGIQEVGGAVTQMDQATQQNASLVEESAAAASRMAVEAEELVRVVARFRAAESEARVAGADVPSVQHAQMSPSRPIAPKPIAQPPRKALASTAPEEEWQQF